MKRQTTVRLPAGLADTVDVVARVRGVSVNALIVSALEAEVRRSRESEAFTTEARRRAARDQHVYDRLLPDTVVRDWSSDEFFANTGQPTKDDQPIAADGTVLDSPDKLLAFLETVNAERNAE